MKSVPSGSRLTGGVYAVTDGPRDDLFAAVEAALAGGARLVQYRDDTHDDERRRSEVDALSAMCARYDVPLLVDTDIELALESGTGLHLPRDTVTVREARARLGPDAIIGVACHDSLGHARRARDEGANYVSFGAMYPSTTKPKAAVVPHDVLTQARSLGIAVVAIGGITPDNARVLIDAGADYLAVVAAIFAAPDIQTATRRFADLFDPRPGILR